MNKLIMQIASLDDYYTWVEPTCYLFLDGLLRWVRGSNLNNFLIP
jgi:hypothetical protein